MQEACILPGLMICWVRFTCAFRTICHWHSELLCLLRRSGDSLRRAYHEALLIALLTRDGRGAVLSAHREWRRSEYVVVRLYCLDCSVRTGALYPAHCNPIRAALSNARIISIDSITLLPDCSARICLGSSGNTPALSILQASIGLPVWSSDRLGMDRDNCWGGIGVFVIMKECFRICLLLHSIPIRCRFLQKYDKFLSICMGN